MSPCTALSENASCTLPEIQPEGPGLLQTSWLFQSMSCIHSGSRRFYTWFYRSCGAQFVEPLGKCLRRFTAIRTQLWGHPSLWAMKCQDVGWNSHGKRNSATLTKRHDSEFPLHWWLQLTLQGPFLFITKQLVVELCAESRVSISKVPLANAW